MVETVSSLRSVIYTYSDQLKSLTDEEYAKLPPDGKWSKKQELGHLLDSAHTNLRRFVVGQEQQDPAIVYNQEAWVKACNYQQQSPAAMLSLWILLNEQICIVLENLPAGKHGSLCNTGKNKSELHTLQWLADDYIKHLRHHLHHILQLEAIPY